jgi:pilus assembly protein CpaF
LFGKRDSNHQLISSVEPRSMAVFSDKSSAKKIVKAEGISVEPAIEQHYEVIRHHVYDRIDSGVATSLSQELLLGELYNGVGVIAQEQRLVVSQPQQQLLAQRLIDDLFGLGPLEILLSDESISDVLVNGYGKIYIEQQGRLSLTPLSFRDEQHLVNVARRIAYSIGRRVDESSPMVDARLADGSRVNIILSPLALTGTTISIRKFSNDKLSLAKLETLGAMSPAMVNFLSIGAKSRLNILISGGTGAGKTTLLNALSAHVDSSERIITIEDAAELSLNQPHVVSLETRPPSIEQTGEITIYDLIRNALRMRPDRIIVGEVRGGEAFEMMQAMNTGHDGSMSTLHANSARDALVRLENMLLMGQVNLPAQAIKRQIVSAIDLLVHVQRMRDGKRRVTQISEVVALEGDIIVTHDLFTFEYQSDGANINGNYHMHDGMNRCYDKISNSGLAGALSRHHNQSRHGDKK